MFANVTLGHKQDLTVPPTESDTRKTVSQRAALAPTLLIFRLLGRSCHKLWRQFACASVVRDWIRRWLFANVTLGHKQDLTVPPTESDTRKTVSQRASLAPTLLIFRLLGRSCHKLWRQFACASVVRDWIRRWLFANVTLGHKQDLTVPPTESYTRKTVSQRAALAPTLLIFRLLGRSCHKLWRQFACASVVRDWIRRWLLQNVTLGHKQDLTVPPTESDTRKTVSQRAALAPTLLIFRLLGRSCHKLWRQFACASVVRDWIRRWLFANVALGHKQDLTVPPTESDTRKTVSQRAALAPTLLIFRLLGRSCHKLWRQFACASVVRDWIRRWLFANVTLGHKQDLTVPPTESDTRKTVSQRAALAPTLLIFRLLGRSCHKLWRQFACASVVRDWIRRWLFTNVTLGHKQDLTVPPTESDTRKTVSQRAALAPTLLIFRLLGRSCHKLWRQFACASVVRDWIRRWLFANVTLGHKQDLTVPPTESDTRKTVSQRAALAPTLLIFRLLGRSCHKLWRQFACASVVRDWIRRWLFANVTLGHKQDLTVPPTESDPRKTVSQRAALAPTLLIFRLLGRSCHKLWRQFACASVVRDWIRRWLFANVTLGHKQDLTVPPTESDTRKTVSQRAALAPTLLIFRLLGRSCHKLWRQFACASVVRDWIRRWLFANVTLGHKQDLTVPPTESYTRKTVSQRAALAPTLLIFRLFGRSCHKLWRQFACASVVRDWIRRWLFANVTLGHKQDLTVPPTESDTRKTVSQRAALAPTLLIFRLLRPLVSQTLAAIRVCKCRERLDSPMVVHKRYIGTQTRPDSAPNGIRHQEDCFATCCVGSDVAHFSPARPLVSQTLAAIRVCKCRERLDSPMVVRKRYIGTQTRPDSAPNGIRHQEDCFATCCVGSDVAHFSPARPLVSQTLAAIRVCKCRERLDSPMVVANVTLGHKQDLTVPPTESDTRKTVSQRAALAPTLLIFRLLGRSCHKLWRQFACASVVRDWIRRWLLAKCCIGTQTRPDSAPNGIRHQEDCFATCCVGSDVAHFSPARPLVSQTLAAIRVCKCRERLDSPMVACKALRWDTNKT